MPSRGSKVSTGQSEPKARRAPARLQAAPGVGAVRRPARPSQPVGRLHVGRWQWIGCIEAMTPQLAEARPVGGVDQLGVLDAVAQRVAARSRRRRGRRAGWPARLGLAGRAKASSTRRLAASPMAWTATAIPACSPARMASSSRPAGWSPRRSCGALEGGQHLGGLRAEAAVAEDLDRADAQAVAAVAAAQPDGDGRVQFGIGDQHAGRAAQLARRLQTAGTPAKACGDPRSRGSRSARRRLRRWRGRGAGARRAPPALSSGTTAVDQIHRPRPRRACRPARPRRRARCARPVGPACRG